MAKHMHILLLCATFASTFDLMRGVPAPEKDSHGDLLSRVIRNAVKDHNAKLAALKPNEPVPQLVTAAQGGYSQGIFVAEKLFPIKTAANFLAMTGIRLSVGIIRLGNDGKGGCGVIPFHGHPNCYEIMTTIKGTGGYAQLRSDGTVRFSRVMTPGDIWVMEEGAQHYYRNLDPDGIWEFEIAFTCSDVIGASSHVWIRNLDSQLVKQFFKVDDTAAADLARKPQPPEPNRYVADCAADRSFHETQEDKDTFLNVPTKTGPHVAGAGKLDYYTMQSLTPKAPQGAPPKPGLGPQGLGLSIGKMTLYPGAMMYPAVVYNGNNAIHLIKGKVFVAQWTYSNKMSSEIMEENDLLIVLKGSVFFIINLGAEKAELLCHIDTPGKLADEGKYEPLISAMPEFIGQVEPRVAAGVLLIKPETAKALNDAGQSPELFGKFTGDLDVVLDWHKNNELFCPLGCIDTNNCEVDDNEHVTCPDNGVMPGEPDGGIRNGIMGLVAVIIAAVGSGGAFLGVVVLMMCACCLIVPFCWMYMRIKTLSRDITKLKESSSLTGP